jgi:hypothetical protein
VAREKFPNTYKTKFYFLSWVIPPLKKGDRRGIYMLRRFFLPRQVIAEHEDQQMGQPQNAGAGENLGQEISLAQVHKKHHDEKRFRDRNGQRHGRVQDAQVEVRYAGGNEGEENQRAKYPEIGSLGKFR